MSELERLARVARKQYLSHFGALAMTDTTDGVKNYWPDVVRAVLEALPHGGNKQALEEAMFEVLAEVGAPVTDEFAQKLGDLFLKEYAQAILSEEPE